MPNKSPLLIRVLQVPFMREGYLRQRAHRLEFGLKKSRRKTVNANDHGEYMVTDRSGMLCFYGEKYDATLDDVEAFLDSYDD